MDVRIIHLDTSFLVRAVHADSHESQKTKEWLHAGKILGMSTVAWAEYLYGGQDSDEDPLLVARIVAHQVDFTVEMAVLAARLFNGTGRCRNMSRDCMIAATAIAEGASIATANLKDFQRFERFGLALAPANPH